MNYGDITFEDENIRGNNTTYTVTFNANTLTITHYIDNMLYTIIFNGAAEKRGGNDTIKTYVYKQKGGHKNQFKVQIGFDDEGLHMIYLKPTWVVGN